MRDLKPQLAVTVHRFFPSFIEVCFGLGLSIVSVVGLYSIISVKTSPAAFYTEVEKGQKQSRCEISN